MSSAGQFQSVDIPSIRSIPATPTSWSVPAEAGEPAFKILVAADRATRERAYRLAHRIYSECGYAAEDEAAMCISPYDAQPQTLTLLAIDDQGREAGTLTVVADSPEGLPSDEIYKSELDELRARKRRMVEFTRLAIDSEYAHHRALLVHLMDFASVYTRALSFTDIMIEVNPRHATYYRRMLKFVIAGPERPCPRVEGAPALLLRLDMSLQATELERAAALRGRNSTLNNGSLYAYFHPLHEHPPIVEFLLAGYRPMSFEEARYFGIARDLPSVHAPRRPSTTMAH
jgi:hypothetical protein